MSSSTPLISTMHLTPSDRRDILENALISLPVFGMFVYGGAKLLQFDDAAQISTPVSALSGMELMWAFYGYSKAYVLLLGSLEITGGVLMLFKRTRLPGCLFTTTILVNVIIQDIVYGVHLGALKAAVLYQLLILVVLWLHRSRLRAALDELLLATALRVDRKAVFKGILVFVAFVVLRVVEYLITIRF